MFTIPPEEEEKVELFIPRLESCREEVENVKELKQTRDNGRVREALQQLYQRTKRGENLIPPMIEAVKVYATIGEIFGAMREAVGVGYDPYELIPSPFKFD